MGWGARLMVQFLKAWNSPGPVIDAFMEARERVEITLGPVGSGKTSGAMIKSLRKTAQQAPTPSGPRAGFRQRKLCVVRDTYVNLWKSTIPSWNKWVPQEGPGCTWQGAKGHPAAHTILFEDEQYGKLEFSVDFVAFGDKSPEDIVRGYEPTDWLFEEGDLLGDGAISEAANRMGRFPDPALVDVYRPSIYITCNAPIIDTWLYNTILDKMRPGIDYFRQPGALLRDKQGKYRLNPAAENLHNVKPQYYLDQIALIEQGLKDEMDVRRMLMSEFGFSRDGRPVYLDADGNPLFRDTWHVAERELTPDRRHPLIIGVDQGASPAASIRQHLPNGQRRILHSIPCVHGVDVADFAEMVNRVLSQRFRGWDKGDIHVFGDPACFQGQDYNAPERVFARKFSQVTGLAMRPGGPMNNSFATRKMAMQRVLAGHLPGGDPMFLLCPIHAKALRKALNGGYHFRRILVALASGQLKWTDEPVKNMDSHIADADQYAELGGGGFDETMGRTKAAEDNPLLKRGPGGWGGQRTTFAGAEQPRGELMCELGE